MYLFLTQHVSNTFFIRVNDKICMSHMWILEKMLVDAIYTAIKYHQIDGL